MKPNWHRFASNVSPNVVRDDGAHLRMGAFKLVLRRADDWGKAWEVAIHLLFDEIGRSCLVYEEFLEEMRLEQACERAEKALTDNVDAILASVRAALEESATWAIEHQMGVQP